MQAPSGYRSNGFLAEIPVHAVGVSLEPRLRGFGRRRWRNDDCFIGQRILDEHGMLVVKLRKGFDRDQTHGGFALCVGSPE